MEYPKIETLYNRDPKTFKVNVEEFRLPAFAYLQNNQWVFTEKVDGTNVRVFWDGIRVSFAGKTDNAQLPPFLRKRLEALFPPEKLAAYFQDKPVLLYGEGYGAKIQKGGGNYKPDGVDFVLFDVLISTWWLQAPDLASISSALDIQQVPMVGVGTLNEATELVRKGFLSKWGNFPAEGIVMRPVVDLFIRNGERVIAKLKRKDF